MPSRGLLALPVLGAATFALLLLLLRPAPAGAAVCAACEATAQLGGVRVRVQMLSATLVRLELNTSAGSFEDRATYSIPHRSAFAGVPITSRSAPGASPASFATAHYSVELSVPADAGAGVGRGHGATSVAAVVKDAAGAVLWQTKSLASVSGALKGPAPAAVHSSTALAFADAPRFVPPPRGATPPPAGLLAPAGAGANTSGYDVTSHAPDVYVLLAASGYSAMRAEFLALTGSIPTLPRWAFGLWFCWYHPYNQTEKTAEVQRFIDDDLSLDVASLDRDWRQLGLPQEGEYLVNTTLFPDMDGFFSFAHKNQLRVFFNDHPKPLDVNASGSGSSAPEVVLAPAEIEFRWKGLTGMMARGLDYWWYDCHWAWFEPSLDIPGAGSVDANTWGQSVFVDIMARYNTENNKSQSAAETFSLGCAGSTHTSAHRSVHALVRSCGRRAPTHTHTPTHTRTHVNLRAGSGCCGGVDFVACAVV